MPKNLKDIFKITVEDKKQIAVNKNDIMNLKEVISDFRDEYKSDVKQLRKWFITFLFLVLGQLIALIGIFLNTSLNFIS